MQKTYAQLIKHAENKQLFLAVELSVLAASSPTPLHLHVEGLRGTGKTSVLRAARDILPNIERVKGCLYNCSPHEPHCPEHKHLEADDIRDIGTEHIPMPFLEISHSAKISTVVGSIDLSRLTDRNGPAAAMLPGTLAQASRGIVLVDEVNRLADTAPEIADVLLDVMGTKPGRLQIEETGLPKVELPVSITLWAASNPDEDPGPLEGIRRQLSDRFDMCVGVKRPTEVAVLSRALTLSDAPYAYGKGATLSLADDRGTRESLLARIPRIHESEMSQNTVDCVAKLYVDYGLESIRAAESILYAARMHCARREGKEITQEDVAAVATLALRHRVSPEILSDLVNSLKEKTRSIAHGSDQVPAVADKGEGEEQRGDEAGARQGGILARLMDAFKEPRFEPEYKQGDGGLHVPNHSKPELSGRRDMLNPAREDYEPLVGPQDVEMKAPSQLAQELSTLPFSHRIRGEGELQ